VSGVVVGALVLVVAWALGLPLERVTLLAPVVVVCAAAAAGLAVFWARAALESLREARHPRLILALSAAGVVLVVILTLLGIELPREH
jgi:hypothetical protein